MGDLEKARIRGSDAKSLLDNPVLKAAFEAVEAKLDSYIMSCDPDDHARTQRVVLGKQIFRGIRREIERMIEDGQVAEVQIAELEKQKKFRVFQR